MARFSSALAFVAGAMGLGSAGCMGDDSSNRSYTQPPVPAQTLLMDDFESVSAGAPPKIMSGTFMGQAWYKYDDHTLDPPDGGSPEAAPPAGQQVVETALLPEPHDTIHGSSTHAMHIYGGIFKDWGAGVGGSNFQNGAPYSLADYDGIMLWAKMGNTGTSNSMTISIGTTNDQPMEGGVCHDPETPGKHDRCQDSFHIDITLHQFWNLYVIYFADLAQAGWGYKPPGGFGKTVATGVAFSNKGVTSKGGLPFDEWVDDVAFFKAP
jgi:hypothetical protein